MIGWSAVRKLGKVPSPQNTQQWVRCSSWTKRSPTDAQRPRRRARRRCLVVRCCATSHSGGCKMNNAFPMQRVQNFQLGGPRKLVAADDSRHALQETEAWRTTGIQMMVTSSVTHCGFCPVCKPTTQPTSKWEQNDSHRKQKSSTT